MVKSLIHKNIVILEINTDMTFDKGLNLIKQICWHQEKTSGIKIFSHFAFHFCYRIWREIVV